MDRTARAILLLVLLATAVSIKPLVAWAETGAEAEEVDPQAVRERENLANLLNHAQVSIHVIQAFNNRVILDREYRTIINNLSLREIPDERVIRLLKSLMDSLTKATLTDREREQIERLHVARVKQASRDLKKRALQASINMGMDVGMAAATGGASAVASGASAGAAAAARRLSGDERRNLSSSGVGALADVAMDYWDYQALVEQMQGDKENQKWDLDTEILRDINEINKQMLDLSWQLYTEYEVPEEWRLVEEKIAELNQMNRERDLEKRLRMLDRPYMREQFSRFAPYWFYVGSTAQQLYIASEDVSYSARALEAYGRYDETRSPVLKKDEMYASVSIGRAQLLDPEKNRAEIEENLAVIERDPPKNWMTISAMALLYARLGEDAKALEWAQHNIDLARGDVVVHQEVMAEVLAQSGDHQALGELVAKLVAGGNAKTFEILEMMGPLDASQVANSLLPRLVSIQLAIEERALRDDHILVGVPLALEADMKELSLFAGTAVYDPRAGKRTVEAEALNPDHVTHSENGQRATFRFEGVFDAGDWAEADRSHVLLLLQESGRTIEVLYVIVALPDGEPPIRFDLDHLAIDGTQFRLVDDRLVVAAPLLKKEFEASLAGLIYELGQRYEVEGENGASKIGDLAAAAEAEGDSDSVRELVRRMKDDPNTSYFEVVELARAQANPRATISSLPFSSLAVGREENLLGATYSLGSSALSYVGAGDYGEGREDLVLTFPAKWLGGEDSVSTTLVVGEQEIEGDEPVASDDATAYLVRFGGAYHAQQWQDQGVDQVSIRFEGEEPRLVLEYRANASADTSEFSLSLEVAELGETRIGASQIR
jgi:hypothetical protein